MYIVSRTYITAILFAIFSISLPILGNNPILSPLNQDDTPRIPKFPRCEVPGMVGASPTLVCPIIQRLKEENEQIKKGETPPVNSLNQNTLLLMGETGVGKTMLAKKIAENTDSSLIKIHSHNLLTRYYHGGERIINKTIETALAEGISHNRRVVIVVENIDLFSCNYDSLSCDELQAAYGALLTQMETHKNNPHIYFILIGTDLAKIPSDLQNKLKEFSVHIEMPDAAQRSELLHYYSMQSTNKNLKDYCSRPCVETLIKETNNFNARDIESLYALARRYARHEDGIITQKHLLYALGNIRERIQADKDSEAQAKLDNAKRSPDVLVKVKAIRVEGPCQ